MIKIANQYVYSFEAAIRGMRNPKNSWALSDSMFIGCDGTGYSINGNTFSWPDELYADDVIGDNDFNLMKRLASGGPVHAKYRRMMMVSIDITAPLYWWKEFDTYKVGTVANSCSTMHKIHEKELTLDDFSHDHLSDVSVAMLMSVINHINFMRSVFIHNPKENKEAWWQIIQLLPSSYNQKRTIMLSYEVLHNMYVSRKNHKLDEWHDFCDWIRLLPYSELITMEAAE